MIYFLLSTASLLFVALIMLCRANDLRLKKGWHWQLRLLGFVLTGTMPLGVIAAELVTGMYPSPYETFFRMGLAMVFFTTPHQVPFWTWITKGERQ